jgi:hypothetical protein
MRKIKDKFENYSKFYHFLFYFIQDNNNTSNRNIMAREDEYDYLFKGELI